MKKKLLSAILALVVVFALGTAVYADSKGGLPKDPVLPSPASADLPQSISYEIPQD